MRKLHDRGLFARSPSVYILLTSQTGESFRVITVLFIDMTVVLIDVSRVTTDFRRTFIWREAGTTNCPIMSKKSIIMAAEV